MQFGRKQARSIGKGEGGECEGEIVKEVEGAERTGQQLRTKLLCVFYLGGGILVSFSLLGGLAEV